jgi:hypothetical protein
MILDHLDTVRQELAVALNMPEAKLTGLDEVLDVCWLNTFHDQKDLGNCTADAMVVRKSAMGISVNQTAWDVRPAAWKSREVSICMCLQSAN